MYLPDKQISDNLPDTQNSVDTRKIAIDKVGIKDIKHPFVFCDGRDKQHTTGCFTMTVHLSKDIKGTHMSRFIEILNEKDLSFGLDDFSALLLKVKNKLETSAAYVKVDFIYFRKKTAPISKVQSLMDYQVSLEGSMTDSSDITCRVVVPVTSLCPCSKTISNYGAHNQRSHITLTVRLNDVMPISELIDIAEQQASSQLYGVLKREDEKFVTETAYDNPAFVEDLVRNISLILNADQRIDYYRVESENFESIHNHSAYALIEKC